MPMTPDKIRSALTACEKLISDAAHKEGITMAIRDPDANTTPRKLSHLLWLSREGIELVDKDRNEKAMRWLGFIQGAISGYGMGLATIKQLKEMNSTEDSEHGKD